MDSPPDPKDSDPEALEALEDDAFAEDGLGLAGPPPTVRRRRKKNEKELSATSKLFDINNDGKLDPAEQKMRDALEPGEKDISKEQVHKWVTEGIRLRHFAYALAVLVVLLAGSNLGTSLLAVFLAKETMSIGGNLVDAKTKQLLGTQSSASTFTVHSPESRRRLCATGWLDEYGTCQFEGTELTVNYNDGYSIFFKCTEGSTVNLQLTIADGTLNDQAGYDNIIQRKLCPSLEAGTHGNHLTFSNEEGVQVLFEDSGAGFTVRSVTQYLKSRVGEACFNNSDCKSWRCSDGKCMRPMSISESSGICNKNSPLCMIRLDLTNSDRLETSRDAVSTIQEKCGMGIAVNLGIVFPPAGNIVRKLCPSLDIFAHLPAEGTESYSFSNEEGVQVRFEQTGEGFSVSSDTSYLKARVGEACSPKVNCKAPLTCSDGKCTRPVSISDKSLGFCNENSPLCIVSLDLANYDRLETSRDAGLAIGNKCMMGIPVTLMILFPGGYIMRKLCPSLEMAVHFSGEELESYSFSNEEGEQVRFEQSDEGFSVSSDTSYLKARVGEACSPKVNCKAPLACSDGKCTRRSVCGSLDENPVCTINDGDFDENDGVFTGRLSGVGNVDDALAIRDHCLHGTLFFNITHAGGAFVTRKLCPADVSFDPQHMGVFMLSNKDVAVEFHYSETRWTLPAVFVETTTDQYLRSGRGESCSVGYDSCRDGFFCNSVRNKCV